MDYLYRDDLFLYLICYSRKINSMRGKEMRNTEDLVDFTHRILFSANFSVTKKNFTQ